MAIHISISMSVDDCDDLTTFNAWSLDDDDSYRALMVLNSLEHGLPLERACGLVGWEPCDLGDWMSTKLRTKLMQKLPETWQKMLTDALDAVDEQLRTGIYHHD